MICPICGEAKLKVGLGRTGQHGVKEIEALYCPKCNATFTLKQDAKKELKQQQERYKRISDKLEQVSAEMMDSPDYCSDWLVPRCPKCNGVLSKTFSPKLICLKCNAVWILAWNGYEP